ncbi:hypothetical protein EHE19_017075 [Ruminiclostridium herbifermentans]|uniref:Uncharacterized protein n=1 Tax=Ruminiclostridium herbifermentans TaxID=2488810 RepID=A0A4U7JAD7_9FIRM|nr:hypothetical protein [Ruminiclostridium herbifermentans]QNU66543.1 hypothetical protein EHE19_017075 [Ruminiclostridium herbifermentans]
MCEQSEKSFKDAFNNFIGTRASEDLAELYLSNNKYIQLGLDIESCSEEILSVVPKEKQKELGRLLDKYIGINGLMGALVNEILYTQGLKDGIKLGCILEISKGAFKL